MWRGEQGFRGHLPQAQHPIAPGQHRGARESVHLIETRVVCPSAPPDIQDHAFQIQTIRVCQTRHILKHAPWHRHMAPTTLKLEMEQQGSSVRQGDLKHLIHRCGRYWQFALERPGGLYRGAEQPGSKVEAKRTHKPFEETIGFRHCRSQFCCSERCLFAGGRCFLGGIIRDGGQPCQKRRACMISAVVTLGGAVWTGHRVAKEGEHSTGSSLPGL
jgi:hypothetical protein